MEEDCESRDHSDDDNSPTDTSEDSVEVKVNQIILPGTYSRSNIAPIDLRKAHSSSKRDFQSFDFSSHCINSATCHTTIAPFAVGVAEEQFVKQKCSSVHGKDKKYSRRKASDPRRLLTNDDTHAKRCYEIDIDDSPPPKLLRQAAEPFPVEAGPSTSSKMLDTLRSQSPTEPSAFQPLFFHPLIKYPYVHLGNNVMVPHFNFLHHVPYSVMPTSLPSITPPTNAPCLPNSTQITDIDEPVSRSKNTKKCDIISARKITATAKDLSVKNPPYRSSCKNSKTASFSVTTEASSTELQEGPIDYSLRKEIISNNSSVSSYQGISGSEDLLDIDQPCASRRQRNYKNMTRERRIEANARERTRVHTISAAFEKLRQSVPSYSNNQKLSKLCVLRIACAYILSLSRLAGVDCNPDEGNLSFAECVDLTTRTIQTEGRTKNRKQD